MWSCFAPYGHFANDSAIARIDDMLMSTNTNVS